MPFPFVVILIGPPGSGKGTQAGFIAEKFGLYHFDTSKEMEKVISDPQNQSEPVIQEQRRRFESGVLYDEVWLSEIVVRRSIEIIKQGKGLVHSGFPRTVYEAQKLMPALEPLVSRDKIVIFEIALKPETSVFRNSHRRICEKCGYALMWSPENEKLTQCPKCSSNLVKRVLDIPDVIYKRIEVYAEETRPVLGWLAEYGYSVIKINGEPLPEEVWKEILSHLEKTMNAS